MLIWELNLDFPPNPEKPEKEFSHWFTGTGDFSDEFSILTGNTDIYVRWASEKAHMW